MACSPVSRAKKRPSLFNSPPCGWLYAYELIFCADEIDDVPDSVFNEYSSSDRSIESP